MNETKKQSLTLEHIVIIGTIGLAPFLGNLDGSIVMVASPTLAKVFHTDPAGISAIIVSYLLVAAGFALIFGRLGDIIGPHKVFMTGFLVLTAGSFFCGISPGLEFLVASRVVQGLGSTMLFSTYCAIVATALPEDIRGRAFGFSSVLASVGLAVGAPLGGFIVKSASWHWLFLFNIPFGILGFFLSYKYLRIKTFVKKEQTSFDIPGAFLSFLCLITLVYALQQGQDRGWSSTLIILLFFISIISFIFFILREMKFSEPLVDLKLFKNLPMAFAVMAAFLTIVLLDGILFTFPYFLEIVKGLSSEKVGMVLMIIPGAILICSPAAGFLSDKKNPVIISLVSVIFMILSSILFFLFKKDISMLFIILTIIIFGVSFAFFFVSNITLVMSHAVKGKEGVLSAVLAVVNNVGAIMGVSFFQIVFSMGFTGNVTEIINIPAGEIMTGFHRAMTFAIVISIIIFLVSIFGGKKRR